MKNTASCDPHPHPVPAEPDSLAAEFERRREALASSEKELKRSRQLFWRQRADELKIECRSALDAFRSAKQNFASAGDELRRLGLEASQIRADLKELDARYRAIEFPLDSEVEVYQSVKESLLAKLDDLAEPTRAAQRKQAVAIDEQVKSGGRFETLRHSYRNAVSWSRGERPGQLPEGGVFPVA